MASRSQRPTVGEGGIEVLRPRSWRKYLECLVRPHREPEAGAAEMERPGSLRARRWGALEPPGQGQVGQSTPE